MPQATDHLTPDFENLSPDEQALIAALMASCRPDSGRAELHPLSVAVH